MTCSPATTVSTPAARAAVSCLTGMTKTLSGIGIPGRIGKFQIGMSTVAEGDDGTQSLTDRQSFNVYGNDSTVLAGQEQMDQRPDLRGWHLVL